jgi:hypothetical protein
MDDEVGAHLPVVEADPYRIMGRNGLGENGQVQLAMRAGEMAATADAVLLGLQPPFLVLMYLVLAAVWRVGCCSGDGLCTWESLHHHLCSRLAGRGRCNVGRGRCNVTMI